VLKEMEALAVALGEKWEDKFVQVCVAVWCSVVQCGAVCCSVLQCDAVWCSVL